MYQIKKVIKAPNRNDACWDLPPLQKQFKWGHQRKGAFLLVKTVKSKDMLGTFIKILLWDQNTLIHKHVWIPHWNVGLLHCPLLNSSSRVPHQKRNDKELSFYWMQINSQICYASAAFTVDPGVEVNGRGEAILGNSICFSVAVVIQCVSRNTPGGLSLLCLSLSLSSSTIFTGCCSACGVWIPLQLHTLFLLNLFFSRPLGANFYLQLAILLTLLWSLLISFRFPFWWNCM